MLCWRKGTKLEKSIRNELISLLINNYDQFISGEEISRRVGCSRAAIWKHIEELRHEGYEIEARPRSGYRLIYRPDRIAPEEILPYLHTDRFGREMRYEPTTPSTQVIAHQWAREGAPEGALVIAEEQKQGRGRLGRTWHSPPQTGIWMSLILRPPIPLTDASHLTLLASVGVREGMYRVTGLPIRIKWPNDLLIDGKKVCGILTELRGEQDRVHYVILGIGINVNADVNQWPDDIKDVATSLAKEKGTKIHRPPLVAAILEELEQIYDRYLREGFSFIREKWEETAGMLSQTITARTTQGSVTGVAMRLNEQGALLIRTATGITPVYSAEVEWDAGGNRS
ncbi:biotin--[acetyl-CoA-carboxylase] ligase [Thermoactinomyces daqus]|uniref:Bifunctional ligase/repressor BirA n=1 Tax=Thermoactinomyces daqus TaxID=1329516 RepID=A0A7W1XAQ0_9BACL|nr:biotin--[acetyl-CoA-carboxylase] ligase [Thermoactinomyces daqus]